MDKNSCCSTVNRQRKSKQIRTVAACSTVYKDRQRKSKQIRTVAAVLFTKDRQRKFEQIRTVAAVL